MAQLGYGYSNVRLQHLAGELAFDLKKKKTNKPLSNNWLYGFLRRWKDDLASISPRKLESNRAKSTTPETVDGYFTSLQEVIDKYELGDKPQCIYNLDETGLQPDHRPPNVIADPRSKPQAITSPRSTSTTLIGCANALGNSIPPFFVFKGKRFNPDLMEGASVGARGVMSDSGWSNSQIFRDYLENHFLPFVRPTTAPGQHQPILLIYDGHASHKSPELIRWAKEQDLILFVLPAHSSHVLQPLDVSIFGPFKNYYYSECSAFMYKNVGRTITRYDMCAIACKAYLKAMTPLNIQGGFRKTGIFPTSRAAICMEKLFPCESFREKEPVKKVRAMASGDDTLKEFFKMKEEQMSIEKPNMECSCMKKRKTEKPNASGKAITEDEFLTEITTYERNKEVTNPIKRKETSKKAQSNKENKIPTSQISPRPSTSGLCRKNRQNNRTTLITDTDSDFSEQEVTDTELCCVCHRFSLENLAKHPSIKIVSWAQCDRCSHWVHLAFCTSTRVVRRHSTFLCPHCDRRPADSRTTKTLYISFRLF